MSNYPQHPPGELPPCFNCRRPMPAGTAPVQSGYPPGRGALAAHCPRRRLDTYFDHTPKENPPCSSAL